MLFRNFKTNYRNFDRLKNSDRNFYKKLANTSPTFLPAVVLRIAPNDPQNNAQAFSPEICLQVPFPSELQYWLYKCIFKILFVPETTI